MYELYVSFRVPLLSVIVNELIEFLGFMSLPIHLFPNLNHFFILTVL